MTSQQRRARVEAHALLLDHARWLLDKARARLITLNDIRRARRINGIITSVDIERRRWLRSVDSPL
jgi:hypothetical protein